MIAGVLIAAVSLFIICLMVRELQVWLNEHKDKRRLILRLSCGGLSLILLGLLYLLFSGIIKSPKGFAIGVLSCLLLILTVAYIALEDLKAVLKKLRDEEKDLIKELLKRKPDEGSK